MFCLPKTAWPPTLRHVAAYALLLTLTGSPVAHAVCAVWCHAVSMSAHPACHYSREASVLVTIMATHEPCSGLLADSPAVKEEAQGRAPAAGFVTHLLALQVPSLGGARLAQIVTDDAPLDVPSQAPLVLRL